MSSSAHVRSRAPNSHQEPSVDDSTTQRAAKIIVDAVRKEFRRGNRPPHVVFDDISFVVDDGEFVSVIGPSGCGKTTMLNMIAGLTEPTGGRIVAHGAEVRGPGADRGMVFQQDAIFMWRTVRKNVEFGLEIKGLSRNERSARAQRYIELVGLQSFENYYPKELSGGMKKRVAIATVLANQPSVMLMDEPFGSLDYPTKIGLQDEITRIFELEHTTTIFVTHDIEEAVYLSDRVLVLAGGGLAEELVVPFPRPRDPDLRTSDEMQALKRSLWAYL
jgi:NitT/TauT family transport system ATP-binding protein